MYNAFVDHGVGQCFGTCRRPGVSSRLMHMYRSTIKGFAFTSTNILQTKVHLINYSLWDYMYMYIHVHVI